MVQQTAFAKTREAIEYALAIDATGKTAVEVHEMHPDDRRLTAMLQARLYQEMYGSENQDGAR